MSTQDPNAILNRVRILEAQMREARGMLMDTPTVPPVSGHLFETRSRAQVVVACRADQRGRDEFYAFPLTAGHGLKQYKGDEPGCAYPVSKTGSFFVPQEHPDYLENQFPVVMPDGVPMELREAIDQMAGSFREHLTSQTKVPDADCMTLHMMDLVRDLGPVVAAA